MSGLSRTASAKLPTHHGAFQLVHYNSPGLEAVALVCGPLSELGALAEEAGVLCRVHSECLTGEVFGSQRCDCRAQLELAMSRIAEEGTGVIVYLRQEGRGIGLGNKVRAYELQDQGRDTIEANLDLGFEADERSYEVAADILRDLGVERVRLLTNNPTKIAGLSEAGIVIAEQLSHWTEHSSHSIGYIETKTNQMGHLPDKAKLDSANKINRS